MTKKKDALLLSCDRLLRFDPQIQHRYEAEHGQERLEALRESIVVGLVFYNVYNLTAIVLMPDIFWLSVFLRVAVVTTASLLIAWALTYITPAQRERLVLFGMMNAYAIPLFLFWYTRAPLGNYSFAELSLHLVFGNMLLALRFRHALLFTALSFALGAVAATTKPGIQPALVLPFVLQLLTASAFSIYANYQLEYRRCLDYLRSLKARLRSEEAEQAEQRYRDLSLTDALTALPNRRALDDRLARLFERPVPKAALMIDVDYFKALNDTEGHTHGDQVLKQLAQCLVSVAARFATSHVGDVWCARFGGEEFMMLADIDHFSAGRLARAVAEAVKTAGIPHDARPDGLSCLTVSIGVAWAPPETVSQPIDILVSADTALYEAKRQGRNRFIFSGLRSATGRSA